MGILALVDRVGGVYDKRNMCASLLFHWKKKKAMSTEGDKYRTNEMPNEVAKENEINEKQIDIYFLFFFSVCGEEKWLGLAWLSFLLVCSPSMDHLWPSLLLQLLPMYCSCRLCVSSA